MTRQIQADAKLARVLGIKIPGKRAHKYGAKPTVVDQKRFHSKKEANDYMGFVMAQRAGEVGMVMLQVRFEIVPGVYDENARTLVRPTHWVADFVVEWLTGPMRGLRIYDTKGCRTKQYLWKRARFEALYHRKVIEL